MDDSESNQNHVVVFPNRYVPGWSGDEEALASGEIKRFECLPLREALGRDWDTDAHFAGYVVPGEDRIPRHNYSAVAWYEQNAPGAMPETRTIAVDIDFPDHGAGQYGWHNREDWPAAWSQWWQRIQSAHRQTPEMRHAGTYLTRGGMRLGHLRSEVFCLLA